MTFTVKIALQPFEVAFEAGSIAEAVAILTSPDNELSKLAALAAGHGGEEEAEETGGQEAAAPAPVRKERKKRNSVEAVAPPPMPVPDAAPPAPPAPLAGNDPGPIPAFLDRTATATAVAPPPPMVAPPAVPAAPPVGQLGAKVAAELKRRGEGAADQGKGLVDWLAGAGLVVPGATFQEAVDCVLFLTDEKLGPVATALQIS